MPHCTEDKSMENQKNQSTLKIPFMRRSTHKSMPEYFCFWRDLWTFRPFTGNCFEAEGSSPTVMWKKMRKKIWVNWNCNGIGLERENQFKLNFVSLSLSLFIFLLDLLQLKQSERKSFQKIFYAIKNEKFYWIIHFWIALWLLSLI